MKKTIYFGIAVAIVASVLWLPSAIQAKYCPAQAEGEIVVEHKLEKGGKPPHAPSGATAEGISERFYHSVKTKAKVCFYNGETQVLDLEREWSSTEEKDVTVTYKSTDCTPVHARHKDIRRPGNQERVTEVKGTVILEPHEVEQLYDAKSRYRPIFTMIAIPMKPGEKEPSSVCWGAGRYACLFEAKVYSAYSGYSLTSKFNVCTGETTENRIEYKPVPPGAASGNTPDVSSPNTIVIPNPYRLGFLPGTFASWHMDFDPAGCEGSYPLYWEKKPDSEMTGKVSWRFQPKDPCPDLAEAILCDLAYARAYLDKDTRKKTDDIEEYKKYVGEKALEYHRPKPAGIDFTRGDEIGVNSDCELVYIARSGKKTGREAAQAYRREAMGKCKPPEVIEGILEHEKTHEFQCNTDKDRYNRRDTAIWGEMEVAAHLTGIESMLQSLRRICPAYDARHIEEVIGQINRERQKDRKVP